jgi:hypothetical protein
MSKTNLAKIQYSSQTKNIEKEEITSLINLKD